MHNDEIKVGDLIAPRIQSAMAYNETLDKDVFLHPDEAYYCLEIVDVNVFKLLINNQVLYAENVKRDSGRIFIKIA